MITSSTSFRETSSEITDIFPTISSASPPSLHRTPKNIPSSGQPSHQARKKNRSTSSRKKALAAHKKPVTEKIDAQRILSHQCLMKNRKIVI
jgi:hypothetical protein